MYISAYNLMTTKTEFPGAQRIAPEELKKIRDRYALRRADRYTLLMVASALAAMAQEKRTLPPDKETVLIGVSAFGPHRMTFMVLDDVLDYPEDQVLPIHFSHSVHNAAASYVSTALGIRGAVFALTGFDDVWFNAMELADTLLQGGSCHQVLLVGFDEHGLLTEALPKLWPERFTPMPFEGALTLLLGNNSSDSRCGKVQLRHQEKGNNAFYFGCDTEFLSQLLAGTPDALLTLNRCRMGNTHES